MEFDDCDLFQKYCSLLYYSEDVFLFISADSIIGIITRVLTGILTKLISEADNTAIRQFILRQLLEKRGTDCLKYFLSALPDLKLDIVSTHTIFKFCTIFVHTMSHNSQVYGQNSHDF